MTVTFVFKYNPNHVASGENGGQFTSAPKKAAKTGVKAAVQRDEITAALFNQKNIKATLLEKGKLFSDDNWKSLGNHPDFKGATEEEVKSKIFTRAFGKPTLSPGDVAKMIGMPDNSTVKLQITVHDPDLPHIGVRVTGYSIEHGINCSREFELKKWNSNGDVGHDYYVNASGFPKKSFKKGEYVTTVSNDILTIDRDNRSAGMGARILAHQVKYAEEYNISTIFTMAAQGSTMNGYYTWPRLGYESQGGIPLKRLLQDEINSRSSIRSEIKSAVEKLSSTDTKISSLMKTEEGRNLWKQFGSALYMYFDLRKGSPQKAILAAYLAEKGIVV